MVWSPGKFYDPYHQEEMDLSDLADTEYIDPDGKRYALEDTDSESEDFTPCPLCKGTDVVGLVDICGDLAGRYLCRYCGCEFSIIEGMEEAEGLEEEEEEEDIHGVILVCPHCATVDSIQIYGDNEWCGECWLDPNVLDQESPEIAKLFKGGIKRALERDVPMLKSHKLYGKFVREECGPHCSLAKSCPQDSAILIKCFNEEYSSEEEDSENVGKRKRGKKGKGKKRNKLQRQISKHNRKAHKHAPSKVAFFCSKGGLLEKMVLYGVTDPDTEQPGNTGSQSGA